MMLVEEEENGTIIFRKPDSVEQRGEITGEREEGREGEESRSIWVLQKNSKN